MFNSKYSKTLTVILIIAIIVIIGLLVFVGINWYKAYTDDSDAQDGADQFDSYINSISNTQTNSVQNNINDNNNVIDDNNIIPIDPDIDNNVVQNTTGNTQTGGNTGTTTKPKYKGFNMVGKIEIPKIGLRYPVLESVSPNSIDVAVAVLYGPGVNEIGNTVIIGHNWRNGTFFSNNKKLANGDKIYLTDLTGKKVTYTIYKKYNTSTDDFEYGVRDTKGKREITLSTCTDDSKQRLILWAKED